MDEMVVRPRGADVDQGMAVVSIFFGEGGVDLPYQVAQDTARDVVKRVAIESVRGGVPGIPADADLDGYEVDYLAPSATVPFARFHLRPKATFG